MVLDHYVSQVHLRKFYSPKLGSKKMYAMRKSDLKRFRCGAEDVCRVKNGSTNDYFLESRIIEEFLVPVERNYNDSIEKLRNGKVDVDAIYSISGFVSYILSCSPTAMRLGSGPLRDIVEKTAELIDAKGMLPPPPAALGGTSLSQMLRDGTIAVEIDKKFPQAIAIANIQHHTRAFGNCDWDILINEDASNPFFTSDFPVAIEPTSDFRIFHRIAPLAPDLAIRIKPTLDEERRRGDYSFKYFRNRIVRPKRGEIRVINKRIVRCAENLVFFRDDLSWIESFIKRNARFLVVSNTKRFELDGETFHWTTLNVGKRDA